MSNLKLQCVIITDEDYSRVCVHIPHVEDVGDEWNSKHHNGNVEIKKLTKYFNKNNIPKALAYAKELAEKYNLQIDNDLR